MKSLCPYASPSPPPTPLPKLSQVIFWLHCFPVWNCTVGWIHTCHFERSESAFDFWSQQTSCIWKKLVVLVFSLLLLFFITLMCVQCSWETCTFSIQTQLYGQISLVRLLARLHLLESTTDLHLQMTGWFIVLVACNQPVSPVYVFS